MHSVVLLNNSKVGGYLQEVQGTPLVKIYPSSTITITGNIIIEVYWMFVYSLWYICEPKLFHCSGYY